MRLSRGVLIGLSVAGGLAVALPGTAASGNKYASVTDRRVCDSGVLNWVGPIKLWPPNHKFVTETVTAVANDPNDQVTLTLHPTVTDVAGGDGGPNHDPDYTPEGSPVAGPSAGSASIDLALRAERSGRGDGRTYTIDWVAEFGDEACTSEDAGQSPFVVTVPHDMRGGAGWKK